MASLYRNGWRQGSIFSADLTCSFIDGDGKPQDQTAGEWIVVTQECDLDNVESTDAAPLIELRPIYPNSGHHPVGVRSAAFVVDSRRILHAQSPRLMIAPCALSALCNSPSALPERRAALLKTWLGLRYDRPAVPDDFVDLAKAVAAAVKAHKDEVADLVLDVLMRFEPGRPRAAGLYAVTEDASFRDRIEDWLQAVAASVPTEVGVVLETRLATVHEISLWMMQNTYSADVTQLSITKADRKLV